MTRSTCRQHHIIDLRKRPNEPILIISFVVPELDQMTVVVQLGDSPAKSCANNLFCSQIRIEAHKTLAKFFESIFRYQKAMILIVVNGSWSRYPLDITSIARSMDCEFHDVVFIGLQHVTHVH